MSTAHCLWRRRSILQLRRVRSKTFTIRLEQGTFAGGMAGYLAGTVKKVHFNDLRKAMIYGSVLASLRGSI